MVTNAELTLRVERLEAALNNMELPARVERLEELLGAPSIEDSGSLFVLWEQQAEQLAALDKLVTDVFKETSEQVASCGRTMIDLEKDIGGRMLEGMTSLADLSNSMKERYQAIDAEVTLLKRAVVNSVQGSETTVSQSSKIKVPEPKAFTGSRNSKEVENFLLGRRAIF